MKIDTTSLELKPFAEKLCIDKFSNLDRAKTLLHFVSNTLKWLPTDYKQRTVNEILARGGGNCFELAKVYMNLIDAMEIKYRSIAEINIQSPSDNRQNTASKLVVEKGNRMSVFGRQHNDHRWVEVFHESANEWVPVDPSMNVFGVSEWLKARAWFGTRVTIDTAITNAMIVPFAVFVKSKDKKKPWKSRTEHYLINEFNKLYNYELEKLPTWKKWVQLIKKMDFPASQAFTNKINLHTYNNEIAAISETYHQLKQEYQKVLAKAK